MKYSIKFILTFLFLFNLTCCKSNQSKDTDQSKQLSQTNTNVDSLSSKIDSLIHLKTYRPFNGVILISRNGETLYSKSYGFADLDKKTPISLNNRFVIGSISKQITAVLILQEFDMGHLKLNDPIKKYLPDLKQSWADSVTIHQLLNHTSGIVEINKPLKSRPGTKFSYSNTCYGLLGRIIEKTSGRPYSELVMALFKKCKMIRSTDPSLNDKDSLVQGFSKQPDGKIIVEKKTFLNVDIPAGLLISTAGDLKLWNENLHGGKLLSDNAYKMLISASSERKHLLWGQMGYGYGIQVTNSDSILETGHSGYVPGFVTMVFYYPKSKTSIVTIENLDWKDDTLNQTFFFEKEIRKMMRARELKN